MSPRSLQASLVVSLLCAAMGAAACSSHHQPTSDTSSSIPGTPASSGLSSPGAAASTSSDPSDGSPTGTTPTGTTSTGTTTGATTAGTTPTISAAGGPVPAGFQPTSVTFVSTSKGFALGVVPCDAGNCTTLVTTADGGAHWAFVATVPAALAGRSAAIGKVRFANASDGWVFGPELWSTHDGGIRWTHVATAASTVDVEASGGTAYALVGAKLLRTSVSADNWAPVPGVVLAGAGGSIALHGHAGWVVGRGGPGATKLFTSPDGETWHSLADPCASSGNDWALAGVAPVDNSSIFLLCVGDAGAGSQSKKVLYSGDAGLHATVTAADPPRGGDANGFAAATARVVAVAAQSGASEVYRSGDAGASWQLPLQQGDGGIGYFDLGFTTATQGVAVYGQPGSQATTKLLMTHDAGASWAPVTF